MDRDGDLAAQPFEQQLIFLGECVRDVALHIENTEDLIAQFDRHGQFPARARQVRVGDPVGIARDVGGQHRAPGGCRRANHATPHRYGVPDGQHARTDHTVTDDQAHHSGGGIVTEDLRVIITKPFLHQRHNALEKFIQGCSGGDLLRHLGAGLHLATTALQ